MLKFFTLYPRTIHNALYLSSDFRAPLPAIPKDPVKINCPWHPYQHHPEVQTQYSSITYHVFKTNDRIIYKIKKKNQPNRAKCAIGSGSHSNTPNIVRTGLNVGAATAVIEVDAPAENNGRRVTRR
jgi:hypothetical protein